VRRVLAARASGIVRDLQQVIDGVLPDHGVRLVEHPRGGGILIRPVDVSGELAPIPLFIGGQARATAVVRFSLSVESSTGRFITETSQFRLAVDNDRDPLVRLEYDRAVTRAPVAHWHVHAERGAFTQMLATSAATGRGRREPSRISSVHYPVGGPRFRPSLEDFLLFLVEECGFDARPGWRTVVTEARARWQSMQARLLAHDHPLEVAAGLRDVGWQVRPPVPTSAETASLS
jgi:hypothetical protein